MPKALVFWKLWLKHISCASVQLYKPSLCMFSQIQSKGLEKMTINVQIRPQWPLKNDLRDLKTSLKGEDEYFRTWFQYKKGSCRSKLVLCAFSAKSNQKDWRKWPKPSKMAKSSKKAIFRIWTPLWRAKMSISGHGVNTKRVVIGLN